jgi:hypothetical protein
MSIRIDNHLRWMTGAVLIAHVILTSKELIARLRQTFRSSNMSPHYLQLLLYELPRENISFGRGLAQRAGISAGTESESDASRGRHCRSLDLRAAGELAPPRWSWQRIARTRYSYKRGIKCQPTLALLLLGD